MSVWVTEFKRVFSSDAGIQGIVTQLSLGYRAITGRVSERQTIVKLLLARVTIPERVISSISVGRGTVILLSALSMVLEDVISRGVSEWHHRYAVRVAHNIRGRHQQSCRWVGDCHNVVGADHDICGRHQQGCRWVEDLHTAVGANRDIRGRQQQGCWLVGGAQYCCRRSPWYPKA